MCGIAGFVGNGGQKELSEMITTLRHRGPDDQGIFLNNGVGLAHARLSIIDLSVNGHQPMFTEDTKKAIVFNGEIYNFQELKEQLINGGYVFKSKTDTEVILYLYEKFGTKCFEKLNGMFAIAIYDYENNSLILARDRMGKKPLYWSLSGGTLSFSSELRALSRHHLFNKKINLESLNKYFAYGYIPTPNTIFENVYKLEPGTFLKYQAGAILKEKFWTINQESSEVNFDEALYVLDKEIERSVNARLISDVPLGIFLSGGLDSSTIAYYAQKNSAKKIKTFSIGFREKSFDESSYAIEVAKYLGTDHHHHVLLPDEALKIIPSLLRQIDEPIADPSLVPTYLLSKYTRESVTVALGGDGGDELFAGYPTFQADVFVDIYNWIPKFLKIFFIEPIINILPISDRNFNLFFKLRKFISGISGDKKYLHQRWLSIMGMEERSALFKKSAWKRLKSKNVFEDIDRYFDEVGGMDDSKNQLLYTYMRTYMMDQVLVKVDRASMLNSLEVRTPFLDFKLVDFVISLPYSFKYRNLNTKYILKKLMKHKLPKRIVTRSKKGFGLPISPWLRNELKDFCDKTLSQENIKLIEAINFEYVDELKREHFSGTKDNGRQLWALVVFISWYNNFSS